jgi:hypothetical protein
LVTVTSEAIVSNSLSMDLLIVSVKMNVPATKATPSTTERGQR